MPELRERRNALRCSALRLLQRHRATRRVDGAGKRDREPIAGGLDDAATMLCDRGIGQLTPDRLQRNERAFLVRAHQPRISRDIGHQDRCRPALDAPSPGVHPGNATVIYPAYIAPDRSSYSSNVSRKAASVRRSVAPVTA